MECNDGVVAKGQNHRFCTPKNNTPKNNRRRVKGNVCIQTVILSLLCFSFSFSYSNEIQRFADNLFKEGDYLRAIGEYQRISFFSSDSDSVDFSQFRIAECYRKLNDFTKAKNIYDNLFLKGVSNPELESRLVITSSICAINMGALESARLTLLELENKGVSTDSIYYLLGITYLKERRWENTEAEFNKITTSTLKGHANQMLKEISTQDFKSPKVALLLSTFIPGAGQLYASRPIKGIISFSLNLSLGYLTYKAGREDRKLDAFLLVYFGLQRFYFGNLEQARKYSTEHNQNLLDNIQIE
ncbi:MAG: hypothetical protein E3J87_09730 [Candidatus Cloacimonadota bacterium]|nr:MAG: hypothetical protein E3J87_09730 [Candidatus Cloacimonadota bacterium]